jgi:hypothetical protein
VATAPVGVGELAAQDDGSVSASNVQQRVIKIE